MAEQAVYSGFDSIDTALIPLFAQCPALKTDPDFINYLRAMTREYVWPCYFDLLDLNEAAIKQTALYLRNTSQLHGILVLLQGFSRCMRRRIGHDHPAPKDLELYDLSFRFLIRVAYTMADFHRRRMQLKRLPQPLF